MEWILLSYTDVNGNLVGYIGVSVQPDVIQAFCVIGNRQVSFALPWYVFYLKDHIAASTCIRFTNQEQPNYSHILYPVIDMIEILEM